MSLKTIFIAFLIITLVISESEARRKILRGRKTINRRYMTPLAIPAYAIIILVAIAELIVAGIVYLILKLVILDQVLSPKYANVEPMSATVA